MRGLLASKSESQRTIRVGFVERLKSRQMPAEGDYGVRRQDCTIGPAPLCPVTCSLSPSFVIARPTSQEDEIQQELLVSSAAA